MDATPRDPFDAIVGSSVEAAAIRAFGRRAAAVDAPVLITGETGTGKGVLATAIHAGSSRAPAAFVAVNCAAIPEALFESEFFGHVRGAFTGALQSHRGLFEQAHRGTLFLDEIGELPLPVQAKLLSILDSGEFRRLGSEKLTRSAPRILSATNVHIAEAFHARQFRIDLYHRLAVLTMNLPPLRDRTDDIPCLAEHYLAASGARYLRQPPRLETAVIERMRCHSWPGNIRELAHFCEVAVLTCDDAALDCRLAERLLERALTQPLSNPASNHARCSSSRYSFAGTIEEEQRQIADALRHARGNRTVAARMLGMSRNTLLSKLKHMQNVPTRYSRDLDPD